MVGTIEVPGALQDGAPNGAALVLGVGGCGGNIASAIATAGSGGLSVATLNTDRQALDRTSAEHRLLLGARALRGRGAGANLELGARAAEESRDEIASTIGDAEVVFVLAGLGGGTGSGAAPAICRIATDQGALAIAIVTRPFDFEGPLRRETADEGEARLEREADALIAFDNDRLLRLGAHTGSATAFAAINDEIGELIRGTCAMLAGGGLVNLDIADLRRVTERSGSAMIRTGHGETAMAAMLHALHAGAANTPAVGPGAQPGTSLLDDRLPGLQRVLVHFTAAELPALVDMQQAIEEVTKATGASNVFWGLSADEDVSDVAVLLLGAGEQRPSPEPAEEPADELDPPGEPPAPEEPPPVEGEQEPAAENQDENEDEESGLGVPRVSTRRLPSYLRNRERNGEARSSSGAEQEA